MKNIILGLVLFCTIASAQNQQFRTNPVPDSNHGRQIGTKFLRWDSTFTRYAIVTVVWNEGGDLVLDDTVQVNKLLQVLGKVELDTIWAPGADHVYVEDYLDVKYNLFLGKRDDVNGIIEFANDGDVTVGSLSAPGLSGDQTWYLPDVSGTIGTTNGNQNFSDVQSVTLNNGLNSGNLSWNSTFKTVNIQPTGDPTTLQVGQENYRRVINKTGAVLTEGKVVYMSGAFGSDFVTVRYAQGHVDSTSVVLGMLTQTIQPDSVGFVTTFGDVNGLNTSGYTLGTKLYSSKYDAGAVTDTLPVSPHHQDFVGVVTKVDGSNGRIAINPHSHREYELLSDVQITSPQNVDVVQYNSSTQQWENQPKGNIDSILVQQIRFKGVAETDIQPGTMYWDSTQRAFGGWQYIVNRYFNMTHAMVTADVIDTNSIAETTLMSVTMGANYPAVGKTVRTIAKGDFGTAGGGTKTFTFRWKKGSTVLDSTVASVSGVATGAWHFENTITFRAIGASGNLVSFSEFETQNVSADSYSRNSPINTTTTNVLTLTVQISNSGGNYLRLFQGWAETLQ